MEREDLGNAVFKLSTEGTEEVLGDLRRIEIGAKATFQAQATAANESYNDMAHAAATSIKDQTRGYRELIRSFEQVAWSAAKVVGGIGAIAIAGAAIGQWIASLMDVKNVLAEVNAEQDKLREKFGDLSWEEKAILKQNELEKAYGDLITKAEEIPNAKDRAAKRAELIDQRNTLSTKIRINAEIEEEKRKEEEAKAAYKAVADEIEKNVKEVEAYGKEQDESARKGKEVWNAQVAEIRAIQEAAAELREHEEKMAKDKLEELKKQNAELKRQSDLLDEIRSKQQEVSGVTKSAETFVGGDLSLARTNRLLRRIDESIINTQ